MSVYKPQHSHWPFASEEDKRRDEKAKLPNPVIQDGRIWYLSTDDIECLQIGCGILGSGGGGDPGKGARLALHLWKKGKQLKLYNPLNGDHSQCSADKMFCAVGQMGAPGSAVHDEDVAGPCTMYALQAVQWAVANRVYGPQRVGGELGQDGTRVIEGVCRNGMKFHPVDPAVLQESESGEGTHITQNQEITGVIASEVGGINTFVPLMVETAEEEVPLSLLDAANLGRSVPELQMDLPFIHGIKPYPSAIASNTGQVFLCTYAESAEGLEKVFREKTVKMHETPMAGVAYVVMSYKDVMEKCVIHATSRAWQLGRAVMRARRTETCPVKAVIEHRNGGVVIITGEVTKVKHPEAGDTGFAYSVITITGRGNYAEHQVVIQVQNEIYVARSPDNETMYACTPDIIAMVNPQTGDPITTSEDGLLNRKVSLLGLLCDPRMKTPQAMKMVGPTAFKLPFPYYPPQAVLTCTN